MPCLPQRRLGARPYVKQRFEWWAAEDRSPRSQERQGSVGGVRLVLRCEDPNEPPGSDDKRDYQFIHHIGLLWWFLAQPSEKMLTIKIGDAAPE